MSPKSSLPRWALCGLGALLAACAASPAVDSAAPRPPPPGLRAPLYSDGEPIGDVAGDLDVFVSADRQFARLTARAPRAVIHLDGAPRASSAPKAVVPGVRPVVDLGGEIGVVRFDLCFDRALLPVVFRGAGREPAPAGALPATLEVLHRTLTVDGTELCFANGDVAAPFPLLVAHWTAPDGTRIVVEGGAKDPAGHLRLRSEPVRTEAELVGLLLASP